MRLLGVILLSSVSLSAQVTIYSDLGEAGDRVALGLLEARLQGAPQVEIRPERTRIGSDPGLLLGVDVHQLQRLSEQGDLIPTELSDLEPPFRGPAGRYAVTLLSPYVIAFGSEVLDVPRSWDDLLEADYQDRLIVGTPAGMPDLWDTWWGRAIRRADGDRRAVAWLTTLDARVGSYVASGEAVMQALLDRENAVGVLPRHLLQEANPGHVLLAGEVAVAGLGVAMLSTAGDPEAGAVHAVLVSAGFNRDLAAAMGLVATPRAEEDLAERSAADQEVLGRLQPWLLDSDARSEWQKIWETDIRGRGRNLENLSETLDLILGVALIGFLVFVYSRIRKSEPRRARTTTTD